MDYPACCIKRSAFILKNLITEALEDGHTWPETLLHLYKN